MAVTVSLKRNGVERFSKSCSSYHILGSTVGEYRAAGASGKAAEAGTWTVEFSAGTTTCGTCGKNINPPGTITI